MSSKRSAKRSQASRDSQENNVAAGLRDPTFIRDLRAKAVSYLVGADQHTSQSTKARFPKRITEDPLFQTISYLRRRFHTEQKVVHEFPELLNEILGPEDPEPAKLLAETFTNAVRQGTIGRLNDIVKLCEIHEAKIFRPPKERQSDPRPWYYYAGIVAWQFLKKGIIPTKKKVKEAALKERAITELPAWNPRWENKERLEWSNRKKQWGGKKPPSVKDLRAAQIDAKIEELRRLQPKNWARIFRDLRLGDLPSSPTHPRGR
jgi:hypothetical protein